MNTESSQVLPPNLGVAIGPSGSGKTCAIRIRCMCHEHPEGVIYYKISEPQNIITELSKVKTAQSTATRFGTGTWIKFLMPLLLLAKRRRTWLGWAQFLQSKLMLETFIKPNLANFQFCTLMLLTF